MSATKSSYQHVLLATDIQIWKKGRFQLMLMLDEWVNQQPPTFPDSPQVIMWLSHWLSSPTLILQCGSPGMGFTIGFLSMNLSTPAGWTCGESDKDVYEVGDTPQDTLKLLLDGMKLGINATWDRIINWLRLLTITLSDAHIKKMITDFHNYNQRDCEMPNSLSNLKMRIVCTVILVSVSIYLDSMKNHIPL